MMFKKVLFATNASRACDNAARAAFDFAARWGSKLILFHVIGVPTRGFSPFITDSRTGEDYHMDEDYDQWVEEEIRSAYESLLEKDVDAVIKTAVGQPYREILRIAREEDADMIIMGAHSDDPDSGGSVRPGSAGSAMRRVAKAAKCPVMVVNRPVPEGQDFFSRVVVGTDFSKSADFALQWARKLAVKSGARLHVFHALDISAEIMSGSNSQVETEKRVKQAKRRMETDRAARPDDSVKVDFEVWEGVPYVEILKFARVKQADLIVMAHHTREPGAGFEDPTLGSVTEQVALRSACPVASVNHPNKAVD
jgi:nucleotide-binding universal stress UspA family protein